MAPKKRTVKKGKNPLTRGRTAKQQKEEETATTTSATSETDDNASEQTSPVKDENTDVVTSRDDHGASSSSREVGGHTTVESRESWKDLPSLVNELRVGDGTITYITSTREHREFELDARKDLLQQHYELENLKATMDYSLKVMRSICPEVRMGKVSDAIRKLGCPGTLKDLIVKLATSSAAQHPLITVTEPNFGGSGSEMEDVLGVPYTGSNLHSNSKKFPSPAKMAKYQYYTPQGSSANRVFQFGTTKGLSTNKAARLPKPGEIVYSEGGSPILQRKVPDNQSAHTLERVEVVQPDGSKIEVDIVYRGGKDVDKLRGFKEFAKDVRGIAASRATSVRQNRIQPPKIVKPGPQSATKSKNKPEWR